MDISTDIWGQLAVEASQVYLSDGTMRSPFADTVDHPKIFHSFLYIHTLKIDMYVFLITSLSLSICLYVWQTIEKLPDKVLLHIFSYLSHREICRLARICRRWRQIAYDTRLWKNVSLRPEVSGLHVGSLEMLLSLISVRFGPTLRYIELPIELITHTVLHELSAKCPNLTHMLLDFSTGKYDGIRFE